MNNVVLLLVAIISIIIGPWLLIWALNTLFPVLDIEMSLSTWFAGLVLLYLISYHR